MPGLTGGPAPAESAESTAIADVGATVSSVGALGAARRATAGALIARAFIAGTLVAGTLVQRLAAHSYHRQSTDYIASERHTDETTRRKRNLTIELIVFIHEGTISARPFHDEHSGRLEGSHEHRHHRSVARAGESAGYTVAIRADAARIERDSRGSLGRLGRIAGEFGDGRGERTHFIPRLALQSGAELPLISPTLPGLPRVRVIQPPTGRLRLRWLELRVR